MSVLRPRPKATGLGFVEHDAGLTVHMRNILDNADTITHPIRIGGFGRTNF